jgi:hypothetical protein
MNETSKAIAEITGRASSFQFNAPTPNILHNDVDDQLAFGPPGRHRRCLANYHILFTPIRRRRIVGKQITAARGITGRVQLLPKRKWNSPNRHPIQSTATPLHRFRLQDLKPF